MIKVIFFDVMGVIFTVGDDTNDLLVPFVQEYNSDITATQINELYLEASLGNITSFEFWQSVGISCDKIGIIERRYLDERLTIDTGIIPVFEEILAQGFEIGMISNDVSEWSSYLREKHGLNHYIKHCIISGDVHIRKPNSEIYNIAIKRAQASPEECVLIDDREGNLIAAIELGMQVIYYDTRGKKQCDYLQANSAREIADIIRDIKGEIQHV